MKKVIIIHASKRTSNTYGLLVQIQQLLANEGAEVEIIKLYDQHIEDCAGCEKCILKGACIWPDDMKGIMAKMAAADGIILSSPVYLQQISGKLKTMIDRTCMWFHRPVLYGKPILCVATTKGSGLKGTLTYMRSVAVQWGAMPAGQLGRTIRTLHQPVSPKELERFCSLLKAPQNDCPPMAVLMNFEVQKALAAFLGGLDAVYWQRMGWNGEPYYIKCRIGRLKKVFAGVFGRFLQRKLARRSVDTGSDLQR